MRRADDLADDDVALRTIDERAAALAGFRFRTETLLSGVLPESPLADEAALWSPMAWVLERWELDPADFLAVLDGQADDLHPRALANEAELEAYCDQVASTVGRICVRIWGGNDQQALALATVRGTALQRTNVLRDVREDLARGRVYLPGDRLEAAGIQAKDLLTWSKPQACSAFIHEQVGRARACYEASAELESLIDPECRPTSWAMSRIYRALLDKIERRPRLISSTTRIRLSPFRKAMIAFGARRAVRRARDGQAIA
jgi:phytoene synthase